MSDAKKDIVQPVKGLNLDAHPMSLEAADAYTHALNVRLESEDGNALHLTNESSNFKCVDFPNNIIGYLNIPEQGMTIYFSIRDGVGEIGSVASGFMSETEDTVYDTCSGASSNESDSDETPQCTYNVILRAACLNFDVNHPIHSTDYKITNKSIEIYWTDNYNPMRWLDLNNIPYFPNTQQVDCNLLKIFPDYDVPVIEPIEELSGGSLRAGSYEFFVAYSNKSGKELSPYFSATNPAGIFESIRTDNLDYVTSKSIKISITNIDREFKYLNIAVARILSGNKDYQLVGTFDIVSNKFEYVYTGNDKHAKELLSTDVLFRGAYYDRAGTVCTQNKLLMWGNLTSPKRINYQEIASKISLQWETWRLPYNKFEGYNNAVNTSTLRGYMRDEVYAFEIVFILKSGQFTDRFHIPGREMIGYDMEPISNQDAINVRRNPCEETGPIYRWKVYNTGSVSGTDVLYDPNDSCYKGPYQYGEFSYWESTETYDNDPIRWGSLAGKPIRFHKFPDNSISHIYDISSDSNHVHSVYPMGVRVSDSNILDAISSSSLTQDEKDNIVGYQIVRADRGDNASIVAKGLLFNVGKYTRDENDYYFPNYNYNDLRKDPFLSRIRPEDHTGANDGGVYSVDTTITISNTVPANNFTSTIGTYASFIANNSYNIEIPILSGSNVGSAVFAVYVDLDTSGKVQAVFDVPSINYTTVTYGTVSAGTVTGPIFIKLPFNSSGNTNPDIYITICLVIYAPSGTYNILPANVTTSVMSYVATTITNNNSTPVVTSTYTAGSVDDISSAVFIFDIETPTTITSSDLRLDAFSDRDISGRRFTFMSPQTSIGFSKPPISGYLKLETVEYGKTSSHIIDVKDNPKYTIGTEGGVKIAVALACSTLITFEGGIQGISEVIKTQLSIGNFLPGFMAAFDLVKKLIPFRQYGYQFTSIGLYNQYHNVPEDGNKIRSIDLAGYIDPGLLSIGDDAPINNFQRESSVYMRTTEILPYPHEIPGTPVDNSRFTLSSYESDTGSSLDLNTKVSRDISSFYASIKRVKNDQYGKINSYEPILTGPPIILDKQGFSTHSVFGGDIYITRFADKRKLPFFISNTVGMADDTDVMYQELNNVAHPTYWMSTSPVDLELSDDKVRKAEVIIRHANSSFGSVIGNLTTGGLRTMLEAMGFIYEISTDVIKKLGKINTNLDKYEDKGYFEEGKFYLFAYGIPYFFVESEINTDYRQAGSTQEKDFFPNVGTDIPDEWLQEVNVSIQKDNEHLYNRDYSRLNKENAFSILPIDYDPNRAINYHITRVIYSEPSNLEDNQNNWLVYRANNYYDFPIVNGELIDLNALESEKVLARFTNNTAVYNAYVTLESSNKTVITGTGEMFKNPPQEFTKSSIGYAGTQHKCFVSTKYGHFWIDAKRGEIFQFTDNIKEISSLGMRNWFKENLPFRISKHYPVPTDNSFKDIGLSMGWDNRFERIFITKKDCIPLDTNILYNGTDFTLNNNVISAFDPRYFCDASWTIAYSPRSKSWVSFYSFLPDYYVSHDNYFQTGIDDSLWNHTHSNRSFQIFYGTTYPFEIECITKPELQSSVLNNVLYRMDVLRYTNSYDWRYVNDITFDKAHISSTQQTSGDLELVVESKTDMSQNITAIVNTDSITIPVSVVEDMWKINKFSDVTLNAQSDIPLYTFNCANSNKFINPDAVDYNKSIDMVRRTRLKSDWFKVRLISTRNTRFKKIFKWLVSKQTKSNR
jgi:hypothetical protein